MSTLLKGAPVAKKINADTARRSTLLRERGVVPTLAIVRSDDRDDTTAYERSAIKRCNAQGVQVRSVYLEPDISREDYLTAIRALNDDISIHGVLVLSPLPKSMDESILSHTLSPKKDVDGITPGSQAGVFSGSGEGFAPCTAQACVEILEHYGIPISGKKTAVVGRSMTVGRPAAMLLMTKNATVTICHTRTEDLAAICRGADIIIAATGKAGSVQREAFAPGQAVVDVGFHEVDGAFCGDADFAAADDIAAYVTPVPGGVGAVTTALLAAHTVEAAERIHSSSN